MTSSPHPHGQADQGQPGNHNDVPPGHQTSVTVTCDGQKFTLERRPYSLAELLTEFGVAAGYLLNVKRDKKLHPINAEQKVPVENGMEFFSQAPGGASS